MIRKIIQIDEEKCSGCGLCADARHEGAIDMVDSKAKLAPARAPFYDGAKLLIAADCTAVFPLPRWWGRNGRNRAPCPPAG